jgi:ABC-type transporter Mla MlaB component
VTVEGDVVVVRGPLSGAAATLLWHRVRELSQGGTRGVDVLLHDATLLDTAAVQVLYDVTAPRWRGVVLHARAGTVAHHALDVAGLPHLTG